MSLAGFGLAQLLMDIHVEEMLHEAATRRLVLQARVERPGRLSRQIRRSVAYIAKWPIMLAVHRVEDTMPKSAACDGPKQAPAAALPPPSTACRC